MPYYLVKNIRRTLITATLEPSSLQEIVVAWCFLTVTAVTEVTTVASFGYLDPEATNTYATFAATGIFWMDKLAILLLGYCIFATVIDIVLR